ncbi:MAG: tetratricopeptide repeat protein, partial [Nitrospinaceae bacterium]
MALLAASLILTQCSPKSRDEHIQEGLQSMERENYPQAENSFKRAIEADPGNAEAYYHLGSIFNARQKYTQALGQFDIALRLDPTHLDAHFSRGYAYEQIGQPEKAEKEFATYRRLKRMVNHLQENRRQGG